MNGKHSHVWVALFFIGLALVGTGAPVQAAPKKPKPIRPVEEAKTLVAVEGKRVRTVRPDLDPIKYFVLYFSAGWCGPCRAFTPDLVKFYEETKPNHPEFEIIFMSADHGPKAMEQYMLDDKMPWPALAIRELDRSGFNQFAGRGIPCLVVLDADGNVLSHTYDGDEYLGPRHVLAELTTLLEGDTPASAQP